MLALVLGRELILLDDVTSALDNNAKEAVMRVLAELDALAGIGETGYCFNYCIHAQTC